jgi:hypothetical protein
MTQTRHISDAQTGRGKINYECDECGAEYVTRDELDRHELATDHDVNSPNGFGGDDTTECSLCGGRLASDGVCADDQCGADDE